MGVVADQILAGNRRAASRLMRDLDDRVPSATAEIAALYPHTGALRWVGITGNPGSGKSTLVDQLILRFRARGRTVGVVAIDPSSPFSGGAILGDRIRMQRHGLDDGVFIRSIATRGHLGGLSRSARDVARVLEALKMGEVLIETVGVGQDEVEVSRVAETCIVVVVPGLGDDVQALKAGVLEIADIYVVNKADRPGIDRIVGELEMLESLRPHPAAGVVEWVPPILKTVATDGKGVDEVFEAVERHRAHLASGTEGATRRRKQREAELKEALKSRLYESAFEQLTGEWSSFVAALDRGDADPYTLADSLAKRILREALESGAERNGA